jgi:hypothetical protein
LLISGSSHPGHWHLTPLEEKAFGDLWFCNTACKKNGGGGGQLFAPAKRWAAGVKNRIFVHRNISGKRLLFERSEFKPFPLNQGKKSV